MMTRNDRRAIVFMALALSGAQIPGLLNQPQPSKAECPDIGQVMQNYRPGALNEWAAQAGAEAREAMGGEVERRPYYEERPQAAIPHAVEQSQTALLPVPMAAIPQAQRPETTPMPPTAAPVAAPTTDYADALGEQIDREIAAANGMTLAQYKANPEKADPLAGKADPITGALRPGMRL